MVSNSTKCISNCSNDYSFKDLLTLDNLICKKCSSTITNCLNCTNSSYCLTCDYNLFLNFDNSKCVDQCDFGKLL